MSIAAFFIGLVPLAFAGSAIVGKLEGSKALLYPLERSALGFLLGTTGGMFLVFLLSLAGMPLNRISIGCVLALLFAAGIIVQRSTRATASPSPFVQAGTLLRKTRIAAWILGIICTLKVAFLAVTFALTPAYFDDTVSNWNLRAKVYFYEGHYTVTLPEGLNQEISSYPPAIPLLKTTLAVINGAWSEPLANSVHVLWYLAVLALLFCALRRFLPLGWSLFGTYLFVAIPLPLLHGVNAYGDMFLSAHVLAAVMLLLWSMREDGDARRKLLILAALFGSLLAFTKNEGLLIYGLLFAAAFAYAAWQRPRPSSHTLAACLAIAAGVLVPWLVWKWTGGLTFGNAKGVLGLGITVEPKVLQAVFVHMFLEGNWNLLWPLFFGMLVWQRNAACTDPVRMVTAYTLFAFVGQICIYLFTSLSNEALRQTGFGRGLVHIVPLVIFLIVLLLAQAHATQRGDR